MVTLAEAKAHLYVDFEDDDAIIQSMIEAAHDHLESIDIDMTVNPLPPALRHAVLMLVAHYHSNREAVAEGVFSVTPLGVARLIAPYREFNL